MIILIAIALIIAMACRSLVHTLLHRCNQLELMNMYHNIKTNFIFIIFLLLFSTVSFSQVKVNGITSPSKVVGITSPSSIIGITIANDIILWEADNLVSKVFVVDSIQPTGGSLAAGDASVPDANLEDPAMNALFTLMENRGENIYNIVGSDDVVVIKCAFQWDYRNNTSTDRIKGFVWKILNHPDGFTGEILVGDNTQWRSLGTICNNSEDTDQDILDVINTFSAKGYPVYKFEWMNIIETFVDEYSSADYNDGYIWEDATKISYPKFQTGGGTYVSMRYGVWDEVGEVYDADKLCIINFPVLKSHGAGWGGATIGLKNWMGMLSVGSAAAHYGSENDMHFTYLFTSFALVSKVMNVTYPDLTIVDATWSNPEQNQSQVWTWVGKLLASTDPAAVSWYGAKHLLTPIAWYPTATNPDYVGGRYNLNINYWTTALQDLGNTCTIDSTEISVYSTISP